MLAYVSMKGKITTAKACEMLGINRGAMYAARLGGGVKPMQVRHHGRWTDYYTLADVEKIKSYLASRRRRGG